MIKINPEFIKEGSEFEVEIKKESLSDKGERYRKEVGSAIQEKITEKELSEAEAATKKQREIRPVD